MLITTRGFGSRISPERTLRFAHRLCAALLLLAAGSTTRAADEDDPQARSRNDLPPRIASRSTDTSHAATPAVTVNRAASGSISGSAAGDSGEDPIAAAKQAIGDCKTKFGSVRDYTCIFFKRERIDGKLVSQHVMNMKSRTSPMSIYFKFQKPNKGREAIYVAGRNSGRVLAHDVGIGKLIAGTMNLDPRGTMAMEECRHPITEAGIGALIDTVAKHWNAELKAGESQIAFDHTMRIGQHDCTMIESVHPLPHPNYLFHKVRLYIDHEHGLPIRFEAYDWPKKPGVEPELMEEYTYLDLKTNVGLSNRDFDPSNTAYSFGRF
jgi:hypothetical protein